MNPPQQPPPPPMASDEPPDSYLTLAAPGDAELKVQRSRFVARAAPAADADATGAVIAGIERRFHDARHVCWAWRLGSPPDPLENRNDAGEPSGTAGEPILAQIRKADLCDTVVVVVRYFGGVKLGTGGLARAYGQAAAAALAAAPRRTIRLGRHYDVRFPYPLRKTMSHLLASCAGKIVAEDYTEQVAWRVWLPHSRCAEFTAAVRESSAGRVSVEAAD